MVWVRLLWGKLLLSACVTAAFWPAIGYGVDPQPCDRRLELAARYNGGAFSSDAVRLRSEVDPHFRTNRIFPETGRVPLDAKARVLLLHGVGMSYSSAASWHPVLNVLGGLAPDKKESTMRYVKGLPGYVPLAVEAIDMMRHRSGPSLEEHPFESLEEITHWLAGYLAQMKRETPHLPLVVVARSASPRFIAEVNHRYPGLIDLLVFISATFPGGPDRDARQLAGVYEEVGPLAHELDLSAIDWYFRVSQGLDWTKPGYFGGTPVLCLTGALDPQVLDVDRRDMRALADSLENFQYEDLADAPHNLMAGSRDSKKATKRAYELFFDTLSKQVIPRHHARPGTPPQTPSLPW